MIIQAFMIFMANAFSFVRNKHLANFMSKSSSGVDWLTYIPPEGLPFPSREQQRIVDASCSEMYNVKVNAVAGSGKTTTILHVAFALPEGKKALALLYNARLKDESRQKAKIYGLNNLEVHSFHAFALKYYGSENARTDQGLRDIVAKKTKPVRRFQYDLFIIDEVQDVTITLFRFICKVMSDNISPFTILLLGDERQRIFGFNSADERYLTMAKDVFAPMNTKQWKSLELRQSFRLSNQIAAFLNKNIIHFPLFKTQKPNHEKVKYFRGNPYAVVNRIGMYLVELLKSREYAPEDVFILAPTVKLGTGENQTPLNTLANLLLSNGFPYYTPINDDSNINNKDRILQKKVVVSTFHKTKGLERKVVVVFSFSAAYFDFFGREAVRSVCPTEIYVACTRASELLIVVGEEAINRQFSFCHDIRNSTHLEVIDVNLEKTSAIRPIEVSKATVMRLVKFLPDSVTSQAMKFIKKKVLTPPLKNIECKGETETASGMYEEVYELTGLALPALFEQRSTSSFSTIQSYCLQQLPKIIKNTGSKYDATIYRKYLEECKRVYSSDDIKGYLRLAAIYSFVASGFMNKPEQITSYNWISAENANQCVDVLKSHLQRDVSISTQYEVNWEVQKRWGSDRLMTVIGRIDAITSDAVWELKCTQQLTDDHLLQLAVYAYMTQQKENVTTDYPLNHTEKKKYYLLNMRTAEWIELTSSSQDLEAVVGLLVEQYLKRTPDLSDAEFMKDVETSRSLYSYEKVSSRFEVGRKKDS